MQPDSTRAAPIGAQPPRASGVRATAAKVLVPSVFLLALAWRPLLYDASPAELARVVLFLAAYVLAPGCLAFRALRPRSDALTLLGMGGALGLALLGSARFVLGVAGLEGALVVWPIVSLPLGWLGNLRRAARADEESLAPLRGVHWLCVGLLVFVAVERTHLYSSWWTESNADILFHTGNAAEFSNHWPLENPRVAGLPLTYHFFSYTLPAACHEVTGASIHALCFRLLAGFVPALLAVQVVAAARLLGVANRAALLASVLVVLHADVGLAWRTIMGSDDKSHVFYSLLDAGLFSSPPTAMALVFFLALGVSLAGWLDEARVGRGTDLALAALFAAVASATKGSVMPVAIGALAVVACVALLRRRRVVPIALAGAALTLAALPMTLWLTLGPESYAQAMFRVAPGSLLLQGAKSTGGFLAADTPGWLVLVSSPLWLVGYLGATAPACALALRRPCGLSAEALGWLLAAGACGLFLALFLAAPGLSQLFFAYTGQIGLAIVAGAGLGVAPLPSRWTARVLSGSAWMLLALMAVGSARTLATEVARDLAPLPRPDPGTALFARGLEGIRSSSPKDALIVTRLDAMVVSVVGERRTFFETARSSAAEHRSRRPEAHGTDAGIERVRQLTQLRSDVFRAPSAASLRAVRAAAGDVRELLFVWDASRPSPSAPGEFEFRECRELPPDARAFLGAALFSNEVVRIYAIPLPERA